MLQDNVWYVHTRMLNMCQISSFIAATEGPVAELSMFANFEERKRKSNLLMSFPKIVHQKASFGQIRKKNPLFRFCRPILDIFGLTLLKSRDFSLETFVRISILRSSCLQWTMVLYYGDLAVIPTYFSPWKDFTAGLRDLSFICRKTWHLLISYNGPNGRLCLFIIN